MSQEMTERTHLRLLIEKASCCIDAAVNKIVQLTDKCTHEDLYRNVNKCHNECSILLELALEYDDTSYLTNELRLQLQNASEMLTNIVSYAENLDTKNSIENSSINHDVAVVTKEQDLVKDIQSPRHVCFHNIIGNDINEN